MSCINKIARNIFFVVSFCLLVSFFPVLAYGEENENVDNSAVVENMVVIESYKVSDELIIPGNEFTLTLNVKNNSSKNTGSVLINIGNPTEIIPEYGTVSQGVIKNIAPNSSVEISFNYTASTRIVSESLDFGVYMMTGKASNSVTVRVPVGTVDPFQILSENEPENGFVGESIVSNISFKVIGTENVNDVVYQAKSNGEVIGSSSIGTLSYGITKSQGVTFSFKEIGSYNVEYVLAYTNDKGENKEMYLGDSQITISEGTVNDNSGGTSNNAVEETSDQNILVVGISFLLILIVLLSIILILKRSKR